MQPPAAPRHSIEQCMVGIVVFASFLAVPRLVKPPGRAVMVCVVGVLTALVLLRPVVELIFAVEDAERKVRGFLKRLKKLDDLEECGGGPWLQNVLRRSAGRARATQARHRIVSRRERDHPSP